MDDGSRGLLRQGRSGSKEWLRGQMQGLIQDLLEQEVTEFRQDQAGSPIGI